ncbi:MAG: laccase domain-containing protein [Patescibacteria group bacterium]|jgi:copper oxidase (laccase) domain-containing protein
MDEQHVLSQVQTIFDGKVKYLHLGCPDNFHPKSVGFKERMNQILAMIGHHEYTVIAPKVQFTNTVVPQSFNNFVFEEENGLFRTITPADGVVIENAAPAAIFNADCHCGILYHEKTRRFVLMHLGLKCFYREDGSPDIIQQAISALGNPPEELKFWFGAGIGPCCNGYDHSNPKNIELAHQLNIRFGDQKYSVINDHVTVIHGPRSGQVAYSNTLMIYELALEHLPSQHFSTDHKCTSCQGREQHPEKPQMWSNVRGHKERNLFLAWLA